jgi:hypothetical protein
MLEHTLISGEYTIESYLSHFYPNLYFGIQMIIALGTMIAAWWLIKKIIVCSY